MERTGLKTGSTGGRMPDYKEKTNHGDALMPVRYYHCSVPNSYRNLSLHWHEEMEITLIRSGAIYYDIDFETFSVGEGDLLLISPHMLHSAHEMPGKDMVSDSLVFHLDFLGYQVPDACTLKFLNPVQSGKLRFLPVVKPGTAGYEEMKACFVLLLKCFNEKQYGYELYTKELLMRFFRLLYQYGCAAKHEGSNGKSGAEEKLKEVLSYIQSNYRETLTIEELASVCHFSQTHFMNFFKRYAGMTCIEYINHYRITRAAADLVETERQVMDIALENGFRNISYFNKVFKERFGVTPGSYRKNSLENLSLSCKM